MFNLNDIEFIGFNNSPICRTLISKSFTYYVLDYCEKGNLKFQMDSGEIKSLTGPVAWITFPGHHFTFGRISGDEQWHHRFVAFQGPLGYFYDQSGLLPCKTPVIKITDPEKFTETFDRLIALLGDMDKKKSYRTIHTLEELFLMLGEQGNQEHELTPENKKISTLIKDICKTPQKNFDFEKFSVSSGISYPHFRRLFKKLSGFPPAQFVLQKRLERAAAILRSGHRNLAETAGDCSFYDIYHFAKTFKKYYLTTPAKYRKEHSLT